MTSAFGRFPLRLPHDSDVVYVPFHLRGDEGALWELRQFHYRLAERPLAKWLKEEMSKTHPIPKQGFSIRAVTAVCPGVPVSVCVSQKVALSRNSEETELNCTSAEHMCDTAFVLGRLLVPFVTKTDMAHRTLAKLILLSLA